MNEPFKIMKSFQNGSPEATGLPDYNEPEELENGTIEREVFEQWARDQADLLYDEQEREF